MSSTTRFLIISLTLVSLRSKLIHQPSSLKWSNAKEFGSAATLTIKRIFHRQCSAQGQKGSTQCYRNDQHQGAAVESLHSHRYTFFHIFLHCFGPGKERFKKI